MGLASSKRELAREFDAALLDLDGVVYRAHEAVPGAVESLCAAVDVGMRLAYLTNNASRPSSEVVQHLTELGLPGVVDADVVTSAQAIARVVSDSVPAGAQVLVIGGRGLREPLESFGLDCITQIDEATGPIAAVVQGYFPEVAWKDLAEASYAIADGIPWFVSNTDMTIPTARGIAPGNGSLVQAVRNATGVEPKVAGKPYAPLFEETFARMRPSKPLMIGDRLDTDILGANNVGVASLAVLTGVSSLQEIALASAEQRPNFVSADLHGLHEVHLPVDLARGDSARCGLAVVELEGNQISVRESGSTNEILRATLALAWDCVDSLHLDVEIDARIGS